MLNGNILKSTLATVESESLKKMYVWKETNITFKSVIIRLGVNISAQFLMSVKFSFLLFSFPPFHPCLSVSSSGSSFHTSGTSHISCPWPNKICFEPWSCFMNFNKLETFTFLRHFQIKQHGLCGVVRTACISG